MISHHSFKQKIQDYFHQIAPNLDRWSGRNRYYYQDIERFHRFIIPVGSQVLQIGCGTGTLLAALQPSFGVGIDFAPAVIEIARQKYSPRLHFVCLDAEVLTPGLLFSELDKTCDRGLESAVNNHYSNSDPDLIPTAQPPNEAKGGDDTSFDFIILSGVLGYLSDIQSVLTRLQPFCHPRTRIVLTFHNFLWEPLLTAAEWIGQRRPQPPQNWLSKMDVVNLVSITGYSVIKTGARFLMPKPIPLLSGICNRYLCAITPFSHLSLTNYVIARLVSPIPHIQPTCSVIIPARNEMGNIAGALSRLPQLGRQTEVIFVEGHSRDQTWDEIQRVAQEYHGVFTVKALQQNGKGKGDAVRMGFAAATGDVLMILDADLTVRPEDLSLFMEVISRGTGEFINGTRLVYPCSGEAMPWVNALANKFFSLVFSFLLDQPIKDTLCGTKVLWRRDYLRIADGRYYFGDFDPFGDFDLLFGAAKLNLHIVDVPVRYQPRFYGSSNINHVREGLQLLRMCLYASQKIKFW